jgi:oligosaccharide repeat unit polymerase
MLKNPFFVYVFAFSCVLGVYQLGWSGIYPELSLGLMVFFFSTLCLALIFSFFISRSIQKIENYKVGGMSTKIFFLLIFGFLVDIAYQGDVPLKMVIEGGDYNYADFGIPTFHVAIVTFGGVFSVVRFSDYVYSKNPLFLIQAVAPIVFDIAIVNRGAVLLALISWLFVVIIKSGGLSIKRGVVHAMALLIILYFFGILGDVRAGEGSIEEIGKPTEAFDNSNVPKSYFWTYVYITSPMANLQETINELPHESGSFSEFFVSELMPDFISKRVIGHLGVNDKIEIPLITPELNVSTIYARSYGYLGWFGLGAMFASLVAGIFIYVKLIENSAYRVPALALLNTLIVFCIFDNMITFSGMSLQLAWLLFFSNQKCHQDISDVVRSTEEHSL